MAPAATTQHGERGLVNLYDDELRHLPKTMDRIEGISSVRQHRFGADATPNVTANVIAVLGERRRCRQAAENYAGRRNVLGGDEVGDDVRELDHAGCRGESRSQGTMCGPIPDERGRLVGIDENSVVVDEPTGSS